MDVLNEISLIGVFIEGPDLVLNGFSMEEHGADGTVKILEGSAGFFFLDFRSIVKKLPLEESAWMSKYFQGIW